MWAPKVVIYECVFIPIILTYDSESVLKFYNKTQIF